LARALRFVHKHAADNLQQVASLDGAAQLALEDVNIAVSLRYAKEQLAF
jgi:hypothetical protein